MKAISKAWPRPPILLLLIRSNPACFSKKNHRTKISHNNNITMRKILLIVMRIMDF